MQRIVPNIWFDQNAEEAAAFYAATFPDAEVLDIVRYPTEGLPDFQQHMAGLPLTVAFEIGGYRLTAINAGPEFPVNPSISFMINFDAEETETLDATWDGLLEGGQVLLPLDAYPFSDRYGWVQDRYGVTWQLMLGAAGGPRVVPNLMFAGPAQNRAQEALEFYAEVFGGRVATIFPYAEQTGPATAGAVQFGDVDLLGQFFAAMDSGVEQSFTFSCGVSLEVSCHGQAELDAWWSQLSAVPEAEQCGWCVDRFGVSWQLVPDNLAELMTRPGAYQALMGMKKIEVAGFGA